MVDFLLWGGGGEQLQCVRDTMLHFYCSYISQIFSVVNTFIVVGTVHIYQYWPIFGKRNTSMKCGVGEGWRRSVGPIM
jgi:hypothetical protein